MTKGQRAMAVAMVRPEPEKGGRGKKAFPEESVSFGSLSKARTVLNHTPDAAREVLSGGKMLNAAYDDAVSIKRAGESTEKQLSELRGRYAELAEHDYEAG